MSFQKRSSSNTEVHPYVKVSFWCDPKNWFWENEKHTDKAKEYYRRSIVEMTKQLERKSLAV